MRAPASPGGRTVTSTSTRMPGRTKPATPTTSFTLTATARMPAGMTVASPNPLPRSARRAAFTGSSMRTLLNTARPTTSSIFVKEPSGTRSRATRASFRSPGWISTPTASGWAATTRSTVSTLPVLLPRPPERELIW